MTQTLLDEVKARTGELQRLAQHPVRPDPRIGRVVQGALHTLLSRTALELGLDAQVGGLLREFNLDPDECRAAVARGALTVARQVASIHMQSVEATVDVVRVAGGGMALVCRGPDALVVCMTSEVSVVVLRMLAGEDVLREFADMIRPASKPDLDAAIVEQRQIYKIVELIALWEDRDRIELLVEHGGGLIPASLRHDFWHVRGSLHAGVALCLDVEVPALRGSGDPDPVAYSLAFNDDDNFKPSESRFDPAPITDWAGDHFYVDLDGYKAGEKLPLRMAVTLLSQEPLPDHSGLE